MQCAAGIRIMRCLAVHAFVLLLMLRRWLPLLLLLLLCSR
jgi:hypothetical protein